MSYPRVDDALASEVLSAIGATSNDDLETLVHRFRSWVPMGSTAKWAAIAEGRRPPGEDPRTVLEGRLGGVRQSWACWPVCTGLGAVLAARGHDVSVAGEQQRGTGAVVVDLHATLVVDGAVVDPFLGPSAPVALGDDVTRPDAWASVVPGDDGRWDHLGVRAGGGVFRYRLWTDHLDRVDVRAYCEISATLSGVGPRRVAHWIDGNRTWFLRERDAVEGSEPVAELRVSVGDSPFAQPREVVASGPWDELFERAFA